MTAITVKFTARANGNGKLVKGWYIMRYGLPIGRGYQSKQGAIKATGLFIQDSYKCLPS